MRSGSSMIFPTARLLSWPGSRRCRASGPPRPRRCSQSSGTSRRIRGASPGCRRPLRHEETCRGVGRHSVGYYDVNVRGLLTLIDVLDGAGVGQIVFSSSGSVYGSAESLPVEKSAPVHPESPYARTKAVGESILDDLCSVDDRWSVRALRYFNPAGAHPSGRLGEHPTDLLSNLLPVMMHVAVGNLPEVYVHGDDYDTPDGTGVRDYVDVMDVAEAHVRAVEHLGSHHGYRVYNIGRGEGTSVKQMIDATRRITGLPIPSTVGPRRPGDVAAIYNDPRSGEAELGFRCRRDLDTIVADAWRRQRHNPHGYESVPDVGLTKASSLA